MTATRPLRGLLIVLRQVEGERWCVVRHRYQNGKRLFDSRVATARPYGVACRAAMNAAKDQCLPLGIQANGSGLRRFDPARDAPEVAR